MKKLLYLLIFASMIGVTSRATPTAEELTTSGVMARYTAHRTIKNFLIKPIATVAVGAAGCSAAIVFEALENKLKAAGIGLLTLAVHAAIWSS